MTSPEAKFGTILPEVSGFEAQHDTLTVKFEDGHEMSTRRNTGGWSPSDAIETFSLHLDGRAVAEYQSPYQYPRNTDRRNGFVLLEEGYTPTQIGEYWTSAHEHIRKAVDDAGGVTKLAEQDRATLAALRMASYGYLDMMDVVSGRVEIANQ